MQHQISRLFEKTACAVLVLAEAAALQEQLAAACTAQEEAGKQAALMAPTVFFLSMPFGVAPAAIQEIMPNAMRGQASAIYLFVITLIVLVLSKLLLLRLSANEGR